MKWVLGLSIGLNLVLLGVCIFLNERYGVLAKAGRVVLGEGRLLGIAATYEMNRNYQVRREIFRLDRNEVARVLMLGDSLTAQGEWNAMLGEPLVANRGIDGDTSAGLLARVGDDANFGGDAVVVWIGTNDVLQGHAAGPVAERIMEAVRGKAEILKRNLTTDAAGGHNQAPWRVRGRLPQGIPGGETSGNEQIKWGTRKNTNLHEKGKGDLTTEDTESTEGEARLRLGSRAGTAFSNPFTSGLARDSENTSLNRSAVGPASSLATAPKVPKIFVLSVLPMATWVKRARERNATIRKINARLAEGAKENGYQFIELESALADENGFLRGEMTSDGVHLRAKGYVAVLEKLKQGPLRGR